MLKSHNPAHQYKIRVEKEKEYKGRGFWDKIDLDLGKARVRRIDKLTAEKIIYEYEWLGTMASTAYHYGIFFDGIYCGGVVCVGGMEALASPSLNKQFGIKPEELAIFARGACAFWSPKGSASKLISYALKLLKKETNKKVVIAFADLDAGEIGTVYQAANWWYFGKSEKLVVWEKDEVQLHNKNFGDKVTRITERFNGQVSRVKVQSILMKCGWKKISLPPKHKYIYIR